MIMLKFLNDKLIVITSIIMCLSLNLKVHFALDLQSKQTTSPPPNIILIITDDQDVTLKGMTPMTKTISLLANEGVLFTNAFTSTPICCPSRSSILTGQYAHNHLTYNNSQSGGCYGIHWKNSVETHALPVLLEKSGYDTFFAGKYLNEYYSQDIPPGWNQWYGLHGNSKYYNYTLNENGEIKEYSTEYLTDVIKNHSLTFLLKQQKNQPFFAMITPPAPHAPYTAADRHVNTFESVTALQTPNFNVPINDIIDKHWLLRMLPSTLPKDVLNTIDLYYRKRWQSLLAVDELIEDIYKTLIDIDVMNNTYIIFTSDNGYHLGQFAQAFDKRQLYETDIRIPFIIRGPNIEPKSLNYYPIALIDIAPTILDLAGISKPTYLDGISLHNIIIQKDTDHDYDYRQFEENYERYILIEYWGEGNDNTYNNDCPWKKRDKLSQCTLNAACHCQDSWNNTYSCIRHIAPDINKIYCEFIDKENFVEAYDLQIDPYQMKNLGYSMLPSERAMYSLKLSHLKICTGELCLNDILN